jgi:RNA polymerase sigma-70 factor (ECF subfamily)
MQPEIEQVVELIQRKDQKSLEEALALLQSTVFSFSMKVCGQKQDAEDTMQEVLLKSLPYLPKFESPRALTVWLYKVAKNRCLMSRRKSKFASKEDLSLEELMPDRNDLALLHGAEARTPETKAMQREQAKHLREAIQQLPPEYRLILVLHDMEELSDADISEITGLRTGTIRVRLHRARLFVRKELTKYDKRRSQTNGKKTASPGRPGAQPHNGRCKQIFAELSDYLDDELDDSLCEELEKHMEGCEPCIAFLNDLQQTVERCRLVPKDSPDPRLAAKIRRELLTQYQQTMKTMVQEKQRS